MMLGQKMCKIWAHIIKTFLQIHILFLSFARALHDWYNFQMMQNVFQNLQAEILQNRQHDSIVINPLLDGNM